MRCDCSGPPWLSRPLGRRILCRVGSTDSPTIVYADGAMPSNKALVFCAAVLGASMCGGCAVPHYDVPTDSAGQPTVKSIIDRIQCEIRDMIRDDMGEGDTTSFHRRFLLNGDYDV